MHHAIARRLQLLFNLVPNSDYIARIVLRTGFALKGLRRMRMVDQNFHTSVSF